MSKKIIVSEVTLHKWKWPLMGFWCPLLDEPAATVLSNSSTITLGDVIAIWSFNVKGPMVAFCVIAGSWPRCLPGPRHTWRALSIRSHLSWCCHPIVPWDKSGAFWMHSTTVWLCRKTVSYTHLTLPTIYSV